SGDRTQPHRCPVPHRSGGPGGELGKVDEARLREAGREARHEAAPFAAAILVANVTLAVVSERLDWQLFGRSDWWLWLVGRGPAALLALILPGRATRPRAGPHTPEG